MRNVIQGIGLGSLVALAACQPQANISIKPANGAENFDELFDSPDDSTRGLTLEGNLEKSCQVRQCKITFGNCLATKLHQKTYYAALSEASCDANRLFEIYNSAGADRCNGSLSHLSVEYYGKRTELVGRTQCTRAAGIVKRSTFPLGDPPPPNFVGPIAPAPIPPQQDELPLVFKDGYSIFTIRNYEDRRLNVVDFRQKNAWFEEALGGESSRFTYPVRNNWDRGCYSMGSAIAESKVERQIVFGANTMSGSRNVPGRYETVGTSDLGHCVMFKRGFSDAGTYREAREIVGNSFTIRIRAVDLLSIERINKRMVVIDQTGSQAVRVFFVKDTDGDMSPAYTACLRNLISLMNSNIGTQEVEIRVPRTARMTAEASNTLFLHESALNAGQCKLVIK